MNLKEKTVVIDNKTYRYSKIVMLPQNKKSIEIGDLTLPNIPNKINQGELGLAVRAFKENDYYSSQHLYFLSNDKICEGDKIFDTKSKLILTIAFIENGRASVREYTNVTVSLKICKKIIALTDPSLNLPKPSDSFLQVYIDAYNEGKEIQECLIEYEELYFHGSGYYKAEQLSLEERKRFAFTKEYKLKTTKGEITIRKIKENWNKEEHIQGMWDAYKAANTIFEDEIALKKEFNKWIENNL